MKSAASTKKPASIGSPASRRWAAVSRLDTTRSMTRCSSIRILVASIGTISNPSGHSSFDVLPPQPLPAPKLDDFPSSFLADQRKLTTGLDRDRVTHKLEHRHIMNRIGVGIARPPVNVNAQLRY